MAVAASLLLLNAGCRREAGQPAQAPAPPLRLHVTVDHPVITIGDLIKYTISVDAATNVVFAMPQFAENLGGFAISDWDKGSPSAGRDGRVHHTQTYTLETYLTGLYEIPPAAVTYLDGGATNIIRSAPVCVEVKTVVSSEDDLAAIRDIKPPVELAEKRPMDWRLWLIGLCGALVLLYSLARLVRYLRARAAAPKPPVPAHELAYAALRALHDAQLVEKGMIKEYYYRLSDILRHYIERRFGLRAPERTTEEFLSELRGNALLSSRYQELLEQFLTECDMVKFANFSAQAGDARRAHDVAVQFIEETRERPDDRKTP